MTSRFRTAVIAAGLALLVLVILWSIFPDGRAHTILLDVSLILGALAATLASGWRAWRSTGQQRRGWAAISGGLFLTMIGEAIWGFYDIVLQVEIPYPGIADVFYLSGYIPMAAGILMLGIPRLASWTSVRHGLDAAIIITSLLLATWVFMLSPAVEQLGGSTFENVFSLAYPVADLALVAAAFLALAQIRAGHRAPMTLLAAGILAWAITDAWFGLLSVRGIYESGGLGDMGWMVGYLLVLLAPLHPIAVKRAFRVNAAGTAGSAIPLLTIAIGLPAFAYDHFTGSGLGHVTVAIVMFGFSAVVARQFLAVREALHAAEATRRAGEQATALVQHADDMVILFDRDGTVRYANPATFQILGFKEEDFVGRAILARLAPDDLGVWASAFEKALERPGEPVPFKVHAVVGDGSLRLYGGILANHLKDSMLGGIVVTCRDITEEREQQEREAEVAVVQRLSEERSRLINGAAHSLRTPLTPVRLELSLLQSGRHGPLTPEQSAAIRILERNIRRLQAVADDVLEAFRLQNLPEEARMEVDVTDLVAKEVGAALVSYEEADARLEFEAAQGLRAIGDPTLLRRALGRLVMHGFDHGQGPLRVEARARDGHIEVALLGVDLDLDDSQALSLLDPFSGQDGARSGLALYVSRLALEAQGGRLERRAGAWVAVLPMAQEPPVARP